MSQEEGSLDRIAELFDLRCVQCPIRTIEEMAVVIELAHIACSMGMGSPNLDLQSVARKYDLFDETDHYGNYRRSKSSVIDAINQCLEKKIDGQSDPELGCFSSRNSNEPHYSKVTDGDYEELEEYLHVVE